MLQDPDRVFNFFASLRDPVFSTPAIFLQSFLASGYPEAINPATTADRVYSRQTLKTQFAAKPLF
jgi:hypothetical protein